MTVGNMKNETCQITLWPSEEGMDPRCGYEMPCPSHNVKEHTLLKYKEHALIVVCPKCGEKDGPGGSWMLNGELAYGNSRWGCSKCRYRIEGKLMKQDLQKTTEANGTVY